MHAPHPSAGSVQLSRHPPRVLQHECFVVAVTVRILPMNYLDVRGPRTVEKDVSPAMFLFPEPGLEVSFSILRFSP